MGSPGSLTRCVHACMGSSTAQGPRPTRDGVEHSVAFRTFSRRRHPGRWLFRGSIPSPRVPLSTLHRRSCGRRRMTRGRCGSLGPHRLALSSVTPRRFCRRTKNEPSAHALRWRLRLGYLECLARIGWAKGPLVRRWRITAFAGGNAYGSFFELRCRLAASRRGPDALSPAEWRERNANRFVGNGCNQEVRPRMMRRNPVRFLARCGQPAASVLKIVPQAYQPSAE